jgi:Necrosis inducing protein (NPP1)
MNGQFGIMYAWYWPKDQPIAGNVPGGHRHDWEHVVIWFSSTDVNTARILRGVASGHGNYKRVQNLPRTGNNVNVEYYTSFPTNHELQFKSSPGRPYWVWDWDAVSQTVKNALNNADFGSANCPFNEWNFARNMRNAF